MSRGLNRDEIKLIAMGTMLLNHIATVFMEPGTFLYELFVDIGYFTAITMCYFLVEGWRYTHSRKRYALRLLLFALLSQIPSISFRLWEETKTVMSLSDTSSTMYFMTFLRTMGSRPSIGSSSTSTSGILDMARIKAACFCIPLENLART